MSSNIRNLKYELEATHRRARCGVFYPRTQIYIPELIKVLDVISEKSKTKEGRSELYNKDFLKKFNDIYLGTPEENK